MNVTLTAEQEAQRQQFGACVVPGERWGKLTGTLVVTAAGPLPQTEFNWVPPQQFRDADGPCPTCGGSGQCVEPPLSYGDSHCYYRCPDCRGGKPVVELQVPCPECDDSPSCGHSSVVVARATVTLLPVVSYDDNLTRPLFLQWGRRGIYYDGEWERDMPFDPLPVASRDWVAVFEVIS